MIAGSIAGCVEAIVTMPFEVIKTRQQIDHNVTMRKCIQRILAEHHSSYRGLFAGLPITMLQNSGKVGIRFGIYQAISKHSDNKMLAGMITGAAEAFLWITPCERIKIIRIKTSMLPAKETFKVLYESGFRSLWTGSSATVIRNSFSVGLRFYMYENIVEHTPIKNAALAGAIVGAISTVLNNPIDVIKSEMQAQSGKRIYPNIQTCVKEILARRGMSHLLLAGLNARIYKITIGQAVIFQTVSIVNTFMNRLESV